MVEAEFEVQVEAQDEAQVDVEEGAIERETTERETIKSAIIITTPTNNDILLGRGRNGFQHSGNKKLRNLCHANMYQYYIMKKSDKPLLAMAIFDQVKAVTNPPVRFLKRINDGENASNKNTTNQGQQPNSQSYSSSSSPSSPVSSCWVEVSEEAGIEKVTQVLRDLRRQYLPKNRDRDDGDHNHDYHGTSRAGTTLMMHNMHMNINMKRQFTPTTSTPQEEEQHQKLVQSFSNNKNYNNAHLLESLSALTIYFVLCFVETTTLLFIPFISRETVSPLPLPLTVSSSQDPHLILHTTTMVLFCSFL